MGFWLACLASAAALQGAAVDALNREGVQWRPFLEWSLENPTVEGNPFELEATATFVHGESGETRTTGMFYDGASTWKFRFTGTRPGTWTFETKSADPDLDGRRGTVNVKPNAGAYGFVVARGNRWARQRGETGESEVFVPQFVMYDHPVAYHRNPDKIDADIRTFLVEHGFTGFHTNVFCRWFDINQERWTGIQSDDPNPDPRTFEALELLITKAHAAGGVVHLWAWGDSSRQQNQTKWGINGKADQRLQRYIAARLGPLPGWTMGYGYDLWEWVKGPQLTEWREYLRGRLGWPHLLGARSRTNSLDQLSEALDYASYEQHRPDYAKYVETIEKRPTKPAFSEDRFRIRDRGGYPGKDYDEAMTRRGLWQSTMAGGVANIWGNLTGGATPGGGSKPYPNPHWVKTCAEFFRGRFLNDMVRDRSLTDGVCLRTSDNTRLVFYKEDAEAIRVDLSKMAGPQRVVAVDALLPYREIDLGLMEARDHTWKPPRKSDWAIAVGRFERQPAERGGP